MGKTHAFASAWIIYSNMRSYSESVCEILNIFKLLDKVFCLILNENALLLNFLSRFFHLVPSFESFKFNSEQYFACWISVHLNNLRRSPWFVCLVYSLPSNIFYWVLFRFYGAPGDRTRLALNLHRWKTIYLKIIALFLWSFWCTTFIVLSPCCNISSGGEKIIRFLRFESVLRVFFAEDFGIRIDEILLKRNFLNMLLLFFRRLRNRSE